MKRSHAARWTAVSVIAPVAAGVFAGSMVWAVNNDPRELTTPLAEPVSAEMPIGSEAVVVSTTTDPDGVTDADGGTAAELRRLTERISQVRAQTEKVLDQVAAIDVAPTQQRPSQPQPAPQPAQPASQPAQPAPQPAAPAPQPAPPADATTGSS